jgi:hypothetical protein
MVIDPRTWDISQWGLAIAIIGLLFAFTQPFGFLLQWRQYTEDKLEQDPILRQEWVERLRNRSMGAAYRDALARSLAWLDRVFGPPGSAQALGVCFLVAVAYAWVTFFWGWGFFHGAGHIGGFDIMPQDATETQRQIGASVAILLPPVMFYLARWLARWLQTRERNLKARLLKRWKHQLGWRRFNWAWRIVSAGLVFVIVIGIAHTGKLGDVATIFLLFWAFPFWGILGGRWVQGYFVHQLIASLATFVMGAFAVVVAFRVAVVEVVTLAGVVALAVAVAGYGSLAAAGAGVIAVSLSIAVSIAASIFVAIAMVAAGVIAVAGAVTGPQAIVGAIAAVYGTAFGLARHPSDHRGVWAGGLGGLTALSVLGLFTSKHSHNQVVLFFLLFFLILPLVNSLFDWLSWWTTRVLGKRLLAVLDEQRGVWQRRGVIVLHSFADLASSVALLLLMAFALGLGFQAYNDLAVLWNEKPPFDLATIIDSTANDPWGEGFWFTLMLLTTLLPTFVHGIMLLGSPLGVLLIPDRKRLALAEDLENYASAGERQANIRLRAARWHVQERLRHWLLGGLLLVWLLGRVWLLYPLGLINWAKAWANAGILVAGWLVGNQ